MRGMGTRLIRLNLLVFAPPIKMSKDEDYDAEFDTAMLDNERSYELLIRIDECIQKSPTSVPSAATSVSTTTAKVNLPKLQLKKFDGNPLHWQAFWDQYEAAIHSKTGMSNVDKFNYLRNLLTETPLATVSGLSLTNDNYVHAVKLLEERFANPQLLIHFHMEKLVKLPKIKTMNSVKDLRHVHDQVEMCVRNLRALKVETKSYGSLLIPLLTEKLPEELKLLISRKFGNNLWTLDNLLLYFKEELQAKERCCFDSPEQRKPVL